MKNLKKLLAVVLVVAMALTFMATASAANVTDYSDFDDVTYVEAVDLFTALGFLAGMPDGTFDPTGLVTRAQAAKIITYMLIGSDMADNLPGGTSSFNDVKGHWAAPYIEYCAALGIINGRGDGTFDPEGNVTAIEFAKMLLCAVGYGVNGEYTGANWAMKTVADAQSKGILTLAVDYTAAATREECSVYGFNTYTRVAQVVFNSESHSYQNAYNTTDVPAIGFVDWTAGSLATQQRVGVVSNIPFNGMTCHKWVRGVGSSAVDLTGLYVDDDVIGTSYNGTTIANLANTLNPNYIASLNPVAFTVTYNGALLQNVANGSPVTGGAGTMYYNTSDGVISTAAGANALTGDPDFVPVKGTIISFVNLDGNAFAEKVNVIQKTVATMTMSPLVNAAGNITVSVIPGLANINPALVDGYEDLAAGDVILWYRDALGVYHIEKAESFTGTLNAFTPNVTCTIDTTAYEYAGIPGALAAGTIEGYYAIAGSTFFLCDGGYICEANPATPANPATTYVFVTTASISGFNTIATAKFSDGTTSVITVDPASAAYAAINAIAAAATPNPGDVNEFYAFTVTNAGATYALTATTVQGPAVPGNTETIAVDNTNYMQAYAGVAAPNELTINTGVTLFLTQAANTTTVKATSQTVFLYQNLTTVNAYTGISNVPAYKAAAGDTIYVLYRNGNAIMAYAVGGTYTPVTATDWVYIMNGTPTTTFVSPTVSLFTYQALVNGVEGTITVKNYNDAATFNGTVGLYYVNNYDGDGHVASVMANPLAQLTVTLTGDNVTVAGGNISDTDSGNTYVLNANVKYYVVDTALMFPAITSYQITATEVNNMVWAAGNTVDYVQTSAIDPTVSAVYFYI